MHSLHGCAQALEGVMRDADNYPKTREHKKYYMLYNNIAYVRNIAVALLLLIRFVQIPFWFEGACAFM